MSSRPLRRRRPGVYAAMTALSTRRCVPGFPRPSEMCAAESKSPRPRTGGWLGVVAVTRDGDRLDPLAVDVHVGRLAGVEPHDVVTGAAVQGVVTGAAAQDVVAVAAGERVVAVPAPDPVVAGAAVDRVVAPVAVQTVIAGEAVDRIVALLGDDEVVPVGAGDHVV